MILGGPPTVRQVTISTIDDNKQALTGSYFQEDTAPRWHVRDTDYGFVAASSRNVEEDKAYWRLNQFILPFYTMITGVPQNARMTRMWVPKDDEHCWVLAVNFRPDMPLKDDPPADVRVEGPRFVARRAIVVHFACRGDALDEGRRAASAFEEGVEPEAGPSLRLE